MTEKSTQTHAKAIASRLLQKSIDWAFMGLLVFFATLIFEPVRVQFVAFAALPEAVEELQHDLAQLTDEVDSQRRDSTEVVIWAQQRSQSLTDEYGSCKRGTTCTAFFHGRRTVEGAECVFQSGRPYLEIAGERFPLNFADGYLPVNLGFEFETIPVEYNMPAYAPKGRAGLLVYTVYADCPFAKDDELVERDTITLSILIE